MVVDMGIDTQRWNVCFMRGTEQVGEMQTVEADDEKQARFIAQNMYPDQDTASNGVLVMEEHQLSPTESLQHLGNVWDELRAIQAHPNLTPRWADLSTAAQSAWTVFLRECPLEGMVQAVVQINSTFGRVN